MISRKYIKGLGFNDIDELFNYIVDSEINGQFEQVKELVKKLSGRQYLAFRRYLQDHEINDSERFKRG